MNKEYLKIKRFDLEQAANTYNPEHRLFCTLENLRDLFESYHIDKWWNFIKYRKRIITDLAYEIFNLIQMVRFQSYLDKDFPNDYGNDFIEKYCPDYGSKND